MPATPQVQHAPLAPLRLEQKSAAGRGAERQPAILGNLQYWAALRSPAESLTVSGLNGSYHQTQKTAKKLRGWLGAIKNTIGINMSRWCWLCIVAEPLATIFHLRPWPLPKLVVWKHPSVASQRPNIEEICGFVPSPRSSGIAAIAVCVEQVHSSVRQTGSHLAKLSNTLGNLGLIQQTLPTNRPALGPRSLSNCLDGRRSHVVGDLRHAQTHA